MDKLNMSQEIQNECADAREWHHGWRSVKHPEPPDPTKILDELAAYMERSTQ